MAQSGTTFTLQSGAYQGRYMKLTCTSTQDIANNKTNISWKLESLGGSSSYYATICRVNINGTEVYYIDKGYSYKQFPVAKGETTGSVSVAMNNDGSHSAITIYMDVAIYTSTTTRYSDTWQLNTIPRYPTINSFTVDKVSGSSTQLKFNWTADSTIDYLWYSTNNGSSWTGYDTADGTSGNFTVSGLASNTGYNCKIRLRRKDSQLTKDSGAVYQTTYQQPTANISTANISGYNGITQVKVSWSSNMTISTVKYSKDNGATWSVTQSPNATSGNYTFTGLTEGSTPNFKVQVTAATGGCVTTSTTSQKTLFTRVKGNLYVNGTKVATNNGQTGVALKNGDTLQIKDISNPGNLNYKLFFENPDNQHQYTSSATSGTNILSMDASQIASRLQYFPNDPSQGFNVGIVTLNDSSQHALYHEFFGTISAVNVNPTFDENRWTYQDTNANTVALTGNNQILVNGFSKLRVSVNTAASGNGYATISQYTVSGCTSGSSTTTGNIDCANATNGGTITVTARDSRSNATPTTKTATFKDYFVPTLTSITATRNNGGVGTQTSLTFNGTWWNGNFGVSANTLTAIYRYKSNSTWSEARAITLTTSGNTYSFTTSQLYGDLNADGFTLGTTFTIEVTITDELNGGKSWTTVLNSGTPAIAISGNKVAIGKQYDTNKGGDLQVLGSVFLGNNDGTGSFQIHGQSGSNIYWKEYGYGDQFRIIPEFGGTDDSNKLRIQGAVGDADTLPTLYDLMTIGGKNGNVWLKGQLVKSSGNTYIQSRNYALVRNTDSSSNTWSPVVSIKTQSGEWSIGKDTSSESLKIQYTTDTDYNNNTNNGKRYGITPDGDIGLRGATFTGAVNFANNTLNKIGDDCYMGDQNIGGAVIFKTQSSGSATRVRLVSYDGTKYGEIYGSNQYGDLFVNCSSGYTYLCSGGTSILSVRSNGLYGKSGYPYYCGKDLYNNSSGTNGTITLAETAANFTFIEIFYRINDSYAQSVKVSTNAQMSKISCITGYKLSDTGAQIHLTTIAISGTSLTHWRNGGINLYNGTTNETYTGNELKINRVIGWRTT